MKTIKRFSMWKKLDIRRVVKLWIQLDAGFEFSLFNVCLLGFCVSEYGMEFELLGFVVRIEDDSKINFVD